VIIVGKKDIKKMFVLPSSWNGNNSNYHGKICQHLPLLVNQKPKHLSLPFKLSPTKGKSSKNVKKRSIMLTRERYVKPMPLKFKLCKNGLESLRAQIVILKGKSSQPVSHTQHVQGSGS
jgi:hypothetical protein